MSLLKEKKNKKNKKLEKVKVVENVEVLEVEKKLNFPEFDNIKVSTKTFIVMTNLILNIDNLFNYLPISDYVLIPKRRGRKKKNEPVNPNKDIASGSIITLEYQNNIRGVDLKKKKKKIKKRGNYFRNSVTIVMAMEGKKINFKVSRNGKFQMTGCKEDEHAESCLKWFWIYIKDSQGIYEIQNEEGINQPRGNLKIIFIPAMRNIDFNLNFVIDREKLDEYFNTCTDYHSLLETSFGYTGVNIKIPVKKNINELMLKELSYIDNDWSTPKFVNYSHYLSMLSDKDVSKKINKLRYNTFLVFHSGKTIMSGMEATFMKDVYYEFLNIIRDCYDIIEEKLEG
jgi:TATA-box binding protein (TBP) (component of TFIID and TFIIIB)